MPEMKADDGRTLSRLRPNYLRGVAIGIGLSALVFGTGGACINQPFVKARAPASPALAADAARLERDVRRLVETFHPRGYRHTENLDRAAAFIGAELAGARAFTNGWLMHAPPVPKTRAESPIPIATPRR